MRLVKAAHAAPCFAGLRDERLAPGLARWLCAVLIGSPATVCCASAGTHYEYDAVRIKKFYGEIDEYYAPGQKTGGQCETPPPAPLHPVPAPWYWPRPRG